MRIKTVWTLLLLSLMIRVSCAAEKPLRPATAAELKAFNKLFLQGRQATLRRDRRFLASRLAPNFTIRDLKRTMNRAQYLRYMDAVDKVIVKFDAANFTIETLGFRDKRAFVTATNMNAFTMRDHSGKLRHVKATNRLNSVWISTPRGWLSESAIQIAERGWIDGHEVRSR